MITYLKDIVCKLLVGSLVFSVFNGVTINAQEAVKFPVKGVCWVAGDSIVENNIASVEEIGANWVSLTPFGWQRGHDNPSIHMETHHVLWGESDAGLLHTAELAHSCGLQVILKPHIWIIDANGFWRSDIKMNSESDWQNWFDNYESFILHYAGIAALGKMEALCIGTELTQAAVLFPDMWRKIISEIRKVFDGKLTYAANFYQEFEKIEFWDEMDAIGIQAYFPLTKNENPDIQQLKLGWAPHLEKIKWVQGKYGKPVIFTEVGYRNSSDAGIEPWVWPNNSSQYLDSLSSQTQANCYEAMFDTFWHKPWFHGVFIWKWFPGNYQLDELEYLEKRQKRISAHRAKKGLKDGTFFTFSPQTGNAREVLTNWFRAK